MSLYAKSDLLTLVAREVGEADARVHLDRAIADAGLIGQESFSEADLKAIFGAVETYLADRLAERADPASQGIAHLLRAAADFVATRA